MDKQTTNPGRGWKRASFILSVICVSLVVITIFAMGGAFKKDTVPYSNYIWVHYPPIPFSFSGIGIKNLVAIGVHTPNASSTFTQQKYITGQQNVICNVDKSLNFFSTYLGGKKSPHDSLSVQFFSKKDVQRYFDPGPCDDIILASLDYQNEKLFFLDSLRNTQEYPTRIEDAVLEQVVVLWLKHAAHEANYDSLQMNSFDFVAKAIVEYVQYSYYYQSRGFAYRISRGKKYDVLGRAKDLQYYSYQDLYRMEPTLRCEDSEFYVHTKPKIFLHLVEYALKNDSGFIASGNLPTTVIQKSIIQIEEEIRQGRVVDFDRMVEVLQEKSGVDFSFLKEYYYSRYPKNGSKLHILLERF